MVEEWNGEEVVDSGCARDAGEVRRGFDLPTNESINH